MTPPPPRPPKPKSLSPAERSEKFAEVQRVLKLEAAERRLQASQRAAGPPPARSTHGKTRGRG